MEGDGNGVGLIVEGTEFGASGERGFEHFGEQEGAEEFVFGDVGEEIGVVRSVGGEDLIEGDEDDFGGLGGFGEDGFCSGAELVE